MFNGMQYNVDFTHMDSQQNYIYERGFNAAIEKIAEKLDKIGEIGLAEDIRKMRK